MLLAVDRLVCEEFNRSGGVRQRAMLVRDDSFSEYPIEWHDDASKTLAFKKVKNLARGAGTKCFFIIGEAWLAPWPERGDPLIRASKSDRKIEVVYMFAGDASGGNLLGIRPVETSFLTAEPRATLGPLESHADVEGFLA